MGLLSESRELRKAIEQVVEDVLKEKTRDCMRVYKAIVNTAADPNTGIMKVVLFGDTTVLSLPYSSKVASSAVGSIVWVAKISDSWRNAIVWETASFQ